MSLRLDNRVAVVTGGLSGIGAAVVKRLAEEGAIVVAADITADGTNGVHIDVADEASVTTAFEVVLNRHGRVDCVVNSAGIARDIPFLDTPVEIFDRIIAVNLRGTFLVGQAAARAMRATGGGAIVNIASVSGMTGNLGRSAYGASKGGVVLLSRVMAVDLAAFGIRVNVLAPGPIETPLVAQVHTPEIRRSWIARTPMRRYGLPEEMAGVAAFLCSDDASYITGHVLAADGGFLGAGLIGDA